jgi:ABC-2 type transport system ATP-binding protein
MPAVLVRAAGVSKSFGAARVLDDVSLEVCRGEIVGLIGANGAGKTTLIRIMVNLLRHDQGSVEVLGRPPALAASQVGYLPEERGLYQRHTPLAVLRYIGTLKGMDERSADEEARRWLDELQLAGGDERRLESFSKGQQQKVQLAAVFIGNPELLLLDEPYTGLDPINMRIVSTLVRSMAASGRGVLLSAHQLSLVEDVCSRVVMLSRGRVVLSGTLEDVRAGGASLEEIFVDRAREGAES